MFIESLVVGNMKANCHVVADQDTKEAIVIDPGADGDKILNLIAENDLKVKSVINTHGHIDHIGANQKILNSTSADLLIHQADAEFLKNPNLNLSAAIQGQDLDSLKADKILTDGSQIQFGNFNLEVIHTPGHTTGSICLQGDEVLFTGDTLFSRGIGRTDLPTGSRQKLNQSLAKILDLDKKLKIYSGHGPVSTLAQVIANNPYI